MWPCPGIFRRPVVRWTWRGISCVCVWERVHTWHHIGLLWGQQQPAPKIVFCNKINRNHGKGLDPLEFFCHCYFVFNQLQSVSHLNQCFPICFLGTLSSRFCSLSAPGRELEGNKNVDWLWAPEYQTEKHWSKWIPVFVDHPLIHLQTFWPYSLSCSSL